MSEPASYPMPYPDARHIPAAHRPKHTACPACGRHVRTGWRNGIRIVGQHHAPADAVRVACCDAQPCEGSFTPVAAADCFDSRQAPAVAAITGSFPAVSAAAITRRNP